MEQPLDLNTDNGLTLNREGIAALKTSAKWARFVAIFGFIISGLSLLTSLFSIPRALGIYPSVITVYMLVYFAVLVTACVWVWLYAKNVLSAIQYVSTDNLTSALKYLRNLFILQGIIVIIMILAILGIIALGLLMADSLRF